MATRGKYILLWSRLLPSILKMLKQRGSQTQQLNRHDFISVGNRIQSGYTFLLSLKNGQVVNNISGTAVARDLAKVLQEDSPASNWLQTKHFVVKLDGQFVLYTEEI
jgi:hypothetical protein